MNMEDNKKQEDNIHYSHNVPTRMLKYKGDCWGKDIYTINDDGEIIFIRNSNSDNEDN